MNWPNPSSVFIVNVLLCKRGNDILNATQDATLVHMFNYVKRSVLMR